jgi:predicted MFS family arabinose efflux permease
MTMTALPTERGLWLGAHARWMVLAILFLARTIVAFQFQSVAAVGTRLVAELSIDYTVLGTLVGLYMLPGVLLAIPGGALGHRYGDKRVALWGAALMLAGGGIVAAGDSPVLVGVGRIVSGSGAVLLNILLAKMVTDWFGKDKIVLAMAIFVTSWPLGIALALVALPPIAAALTTPMALWTTVAACACAFLLLAVYRAPPGAASAQVVAKVPLSRSEWSLSLLSGCVWAFFNVAFAVLPVFGPAFMAAAGVPAATAAATISLTLWVTILSVPLGGWIAQNVAARDLLMVGCFGAMLLVTIAIAQLMGPAWACILFGALSGPPAGLIMAMPGAVLRPQNRAFGMGVYYAVYYLSMATLMPAAGALRDATGNAAMPLYFGAALLAAAAGASWVFRRIQRAAPSPVANASGA